jgi:hypothetical protein
VDKLAVVFIVHPKFPEFRPNKGGQKGYKSGDDQTLLRAYLTQEAVTRLGKPWPPST